MVPCGRGNGKLQQKSPSGNHREYGRVLTSESRMAQLGEHRCHRRARSAELGPLRSTWGSKQSPGKAGLTEAEQEPEAEEKRHMARSLCHRENKVLDWGHAAGGSRWLRSVRACQQEHGSCAVIFLQSAPFRSKLAAGWSVELEPQGACLGPLKITAVAYGHDGEDDGILDERD